MSNFDIRAMEGLGMKKIELYLADDFKDIFTGWPEWDEVKVFRTLSVADDVNLWDRAINLDGKFYSVRMSQGNKYKIRELKEFNIEEKENYDTSEITCPICGYEFSDSWEYDSDEGDCECGSCGAALEWSRDVSVSYSAEVKKVVEPLKL